MSEVNTTPENTEITEVKKIIGEFKPKRKFLSFVSSVNGMKIRFIRDIAFLKGGKLSGMLDDVIFKITICDEGTIKFDEVDTTLTDSALRQRLLDDIDSMDVTGYAQKFVVSHLEFADIDGARCYLEVEQKKPIDILKSLFDDEDEKNKVTDKGLSILDQLFGNSDDENESVSEEKTEDESVETTSEIKEEETKGTALSYMEESFRKMNEAKIMELEGRIEDKEKDIRKYQNDMTNAESKLKQTTEDLGILETRLETMSPGDSPNGYAFYVSDEQKNETGLDEATKEIADKIADLMNLKKEVLFKYLTGGFYKIKIAKKDDLMSETLVMEREVSEKLSSIDPIGKLTMTGIGEFEYRGELNWHQLVGKFIRKGFEQVPEFDKHCESNSYDSKEEEKKKLELDTNTCSHTNCDEDNKNTKVDADFKTIPLKTILTPQTLVILGGDFNGRDIEVTDDFSGIDIYIGGVKNTSMETEGHVKIVSLDDYKSWLSQFQDIDDACSVDAYLLPNFSGDIEVGVKLEDGSYSTDFDLSDYIHHQSAFDGLDIDVFINLPKGTNVVNIDGHNLKSVISNLRDSTIDKIIK